MVFDGFSYNGRSTKDFHVRVERYPKLGSPARKLETVQVPGRNGDLHMEQDAFHNYTQPYEIYFHGPAASPEQAHAIKAWLMGSKGYRRLEDVYDPAHFRLAAFSGPMDISNWLNKYGRCTVQFDCKPQAFLKSGEAAVSLNGPASLHNPCAFASKPLIRVFGSGSGVLAVNETEVTIHAIDQYVDLDCDLQNAFRDLENKNSEIYAPEFPQLVPGENTVSWTGGISRVEIIPRWWEL